MQLERKISKLCTECYKRFIIYNAFTILFYFKSKNLSSTYWDINNINKILHKLVYKLS